MVSISFDSAHEAELFLHICQYDSGNERLLSHMSRNAGNTVVGLEQQSGLDALVPLKRVFFIYIQKEWLPLWLDRIVKESFYYKEQDECDQIIEIAGMMMMMENEQTTAFWGRLQQNLEEGLSSILERGVPFSFSAFLAFREKRILQELMYFVETAIDEYKMEQEYLNFIHTLRGYMHSVSPKLPRLHVVHKEHFMFYNDSLQELNRADLVRYTDRRLFSDYPMYIDSNVLAPLISIAPEILSVYSDEENHPILMTVRRIFEERVEILPLSEFGKNANFQNIADEK
ncbi:sporulation protein YtxC [Bacillus sp. 1P06AnD]|uniref:sporulation protein YtxC n=1 Tax=Bacillus sp. 1P06AnD TaxID=3132208 RepID=UPI0039A1F225